MSRDVNGPDVPRGYVSPCVLAGAAPGTPVLLGLSGGADSSSLLDIAARTGENLVLCQVNHCIRGDEADRDELFCRSLAQRYGLRIEVFREDVPAEAARTGEGLEEAARRIRYSVFEKLMKELDIPVLATAHNADDNAETVLFNIVRGASARGACGIPAVRRAGECGTVVRPLLRVSRKAILEYCDTRGLEYVTDSTNADDTYSRNRIRLNVMPELRRINPDAVDAISRYSESVSGDCAWLDSEAASFTDTHGGALPYGELLKLPPPVARRVITAAARRAGARPEYRHVEALWTAVLGGLRVSVTLPGSVKGTADPRDGISFRFDPREKKIRPSGNRDEE